MNQLHMNKQQALKEILRVSHEALTTIPLNQTPEMQLMVEAMQQVHTMAKSALEINTQQTVSKGGELR